MTGAYSPLGRPCLADPSHQPQSQSHLFKQRHLALSGRRRVQGLEGNAYRVCEGSILRGAIAQRDGGPGGEFRF